MDRYFIGLIAAFLLISTSLSAQNTISGKVVDESGEAVGFATVILRGEDGTVVDGKSVSENGTYELTSRKGTYMLCAELVGYKPASVRVDITSGLKTFPDLVLTLDSELLGGAVVSAVIPKTTLTGEGIQTSVRGTVLENVGTANDVLSKTPGLIKTKDGLEVIGKGSPLIYVNGRKVQDKNELDRILSSEVQSVEVITNPGVQYDASVRSVVRIRTIRREGDGFGFNSSISDEQCLDYADINNPAFNLNANYRIRSVDIFAGLDYKRYNGRQDSDTLWQRTHGTPESLQAGGLFAVYDQSWITLNGGLNWQISPNHSVGFKVDWSDGMKIAGHQELWETLSLDGKITDDIVAVGDSFNDEKDPFVIKANAYYNGTAGKLGIDLNVDYYGKNNIEKQHTEETSPTGMSPKSDIDTRNVGIGRMLAAKLVLSYPVWQGSLQAGTEDVFTRHSDEYSITGTTIPPSETKVREDNYAAFANYSFSLKKVGQFSAGVRYEHVNYKYVDLLNPSADVERKYDHFYPSVSYSGAIGKVQLMANYGIKTSRPSFSQLSSAIQYNSKYIVQSGDAQLQPETNNEFGLTASWKFLVFMLNYNRTDNEITNWSSRLTESDPMVIVKPVNLSDPVRRLSFFVNATPTIGIWTMNWTAGIQQQWLNIKEYNISFNDKPMLFARLLNTFTVKGGWQFEAGVEYHSPMYYSNIYVISHYLDLTAAVQKSFLKDKSLVLRLEGSDLAGKFSDKLYANFGAHELGQSNNMSTRALKLTLMYKFNSTQSKYKGRGAGQEAAGRMK